MLSTLWRSFPRAISKLQQASPKVQRNQLQHQELLNRLTAAFATFAHKDFAYEKSHGESGSLIHRFVKHIAIENCKLETVQPTSSSIKYSSYFPIHEPHAFIKTLKNTSNDQLKRLLAFTYTYKTNAEYQKLALVINEIDNECCRRLNQLTREEIFQVLYGFMYCIPNKINQLEFFNNSVQKLVAEFDARSCSERDFVQTCFYLGVGKKNRHNSETMKTFLTHHLDTYLHQLSRLDFAIVSNAAFKTATKSESAQFNDRLVLEVVACNVDEPGLLANFVKSCRLNRIQSDEVRQKLTQLVLGGAEFEFRGLVHIFAYFADNLVKDDKLVHLLVSKGMDMLIEDCQRQQHKSPEENVASDMRAKDVGTFVWCCAYLNTNILTQDNLKMLEAIISDKVYENEYKYKPDEFIDTVLSMWILGFKSEWLARQIVESGSTKVTGNVSRVKLDSRKTLLTSCIEIELPKVLEGSRKNSKNLINETTKAPDYLINKRAELKRVVSLLDGLRDKHNLMDIETVCPIKALNIAGISVQSSDGERIHIEVADETNTLEDNKSPTGLFAMKMRLLEAAGKNVELINPIGKSDADLMVTLTELLGERRQAQSQIT